MSEAVIVDAVRTPIGRAIRGTLRDLRADDLAAIPLRALVERNPEVDFAGDGRRDDGLWLPGPRAGLQRGPQRGAAGRTRPPCPGGHGQSLLRIVAADDPHGVPRDQGGRRRPVHRGGRGMHVARRRHDASGDEPAARRLERHRLQRLHPDGDDGGERGRALQGLPRGPGRVGGALSAARGRGTRERPLRPRDRRCRHTGDSRRRRRRDPGAHGHAGRRAARGHDGRVAGEAQAGLQAGWHGDRGQRLPAQRRRRRRAGDVGGEGPRARPQAPGADRRVRGGGGPPEIMGLGPIPGGQGGAARQRA